MKKEKKTFKDVITEALKGVDNLTPVDMGDQLIPVSRKNGRTVLMKRKDFVKQQSNNTKYQ